VKLRTSPTPITNRCRPDLLAVHSIHGQTPPAWSGGCPTLIKGFLDLLTLRLCVQVQPWFIATALHQVHLLVPLGHATLVLLLFTECPPPENHFGLCIRPFKTPATSQ
jgi:hypothetical protein